MPGKRSYGKQMGSHHWGGRHPKMSPEKIQSERIKLLEQGIKLKKKLAKKGSNLSTRDMEEALQFSKKARALNMAADNIQCSSCHGKVTLEQYAYRKKAHPGERMLCTGCAMSM